MEVTEVIILILRIIPATIMTDEELRKGILSVGLLIVTTIATINHGRSCFVRLCMLLLCWLTNSHLSRLLPQPVHAPVISDEDDNAVLQVQVQQAGPSQSVVIRQAVPPYGQRRGWKPTSMEDFGALCRWLAVYPSDMYCRGWWCVS